MTSSFSFKRFDQQSGLYFLAGGSERNRL